MATETGVKLLSALRRAGSTSALRDISDSFFTEPDEKNAFEWLRQHVSIYRAFPDPGVFFRNTGIRTLNVTQPLNFYLDEARKRALYGLLMGPFGYMRDAMESMNPDAVISLAKEIMQTSAKFSAKSNDYTTLDTALQLVVQDFHDAQATYGLRGIPSGWDFVDEQTGGWQNDDIISVVGRIARGKTFVLLFLAYSAWRAGYSILFNTNELGAVQLVRRLFGIHTKLNPELIRKGRLSTWVANSVDHLASGMLNGVPFNLIVGGFKKSVETLSAVAEVTSPDLIISDSAYLLEPIKKRRGAESRYETVSDTIEDLKRLNIELNRPIILSVQFNRKAEAVKVRGQQNSSPVAHLSLAKIGDTDNIGRASSIVIGLEKAAPPNEDTRRWLTFLKGREGETGTFQINYRFDPLNFSIISTGEGTTQEQPNVSYME